MVPPGTASFCTWFAQFRYFLHIYRHICTYTAIFCTFSRKSRASLQYSKLHCVIPRGGCAIETELRLALDACESVFVMIRRPHKHLQLRALVSIDKNSHGKRLRTYRNIPYWLLNSRICHQHVRVSPGPVLTQTQRSHVAMGYMIV